MPVDLTSVAERQQQLDEQQNYEKTPWLKLKEGINQLRILPPFGDKKLPYVEFKKVFNAGPNKKSFIPRAQYGLECPFAQWQNDMSKKTDEASKKEVARTSLRSRCAFVVIDRNNEPAGPQVFETNTQVLHAIQAIMLDPEFGDITDPSTKGLDIKIDYKKEGKTGFSEFDVRPCRTGSILTGIEDIWQTWLGTDWLEHYGVGKPSDAKWIAAVLAGTEEQLKNGGTQAPSNPAGIAALPAGAQPAKYPYAPDTQFYVVEGNQSVLRPASEIYSRVCKGENPLCVPANDQSRGWQDAVVYGFVAPAAPPLPPPPPAAPVLPPPPPSVPSSPPPSTSVSPPFPGAPATPAAPMTPPPTGPSPTLAPWQNAPATPAPVSPHQFPTNQVAADLRQSLAS